VGGDGVLRAPYSYPAASNGKIEATENRPQPRVREADCVGCRLCYNVCPVDRCISMVEVPSGRDPVTWDELVRARPEVAQDWEAMQEYRRKAGIHVH
jgi:dihydropyrimidine dehydrogenase (NAD+) subunit PreA